MTIVVVYGLLLTSTGCTYQLWDWALRHPENPHHFTAQEQDIAQTQDSGGHLSLVISYQVHHSSSRCPMLVIPLDESGRPPKAMQYSGHAKTRAEFWDGISTWQRGDIQRRCSGCRATTKAAGDFEQCDAYPGYAMLECEDSQANHRPDSLAAIAYRYDGSRIVLVDAFRDDRMDIPSGTQVVLLPEDPVDDPGQPGRIMAAVAGTPFTLAADLALSPIYAAFVISMSMPVQTDFAAGPPSLSHPATQP